MKRLWTIIRNIVKSEYLSLILRLVMGIIFIYASMTKIPYPAEFAKNVEAYRLFPYWSINVIAVFLPWLEMICGLFLIIGLLTRASAAVLTVLIAGFTIGLTINVIRGSPISCGCFDSVGSQIGWYDVVRDIVLLLLTVQIFFFDRILIFRRGGFLAQKQPYREN
jgi:uncharacterized membrane protein YphA (DoxX/SURF4 family)